MIDLIIKSVVDDYDVEDDTSNDDEEDVQSLRQKEDSCSFPMFTSQEVQISEMQ